MWDENKIRIIDIAEELGVSTATVSYVLHGKTEHVSKSTIEKVQRKLEERGYIPNMAATLLAQNNSRIIGVIANNHPKYENHLFEDPYLASAINYLSDEIGAAGYFMMLKKAKQISEIVNFASMWNLDGMVIMGFCEDEYQNLRNSIRIPFVVYDGFFENKGRICNIRVDNFDGGRQIGEYFASLGHKRVLCISDNKICMDLERYQGLCNGLGYESDFMQIPMEKNNRLSFYEKNLDRIKCYTAIFAVSDFYAIELMSLLQQKDISIPKDISIAGFDGTAICSRINPTLTSIAQNNANRARIAIEEIFKMRADENYKQDMVLPVKLIVGKSTGKAKV